jgi:hypothetical protein
MIPFAGSNGRRCFGLVLIVLLLACLGSLGWGGVDDNATGPEGAQVISFGHELTKTSGSALLKRKGGGTIADSLSGSALRLKSGEFLTLDAGRLIDPASGSMSFWVRPHWDDKDASSHTFLSFPWQDGKNGYFTISRGWWEPKGSGLTYLIGNNQDYSNLARNIRYKKGEWTHLAVVWKGGRPGFVRLYVNGVLAAQDMRYTGGYRPGKELYLGSDQGTPLANRRWADADFDELTFFQHTLDDNEIRALYNRQNPYRRDPLVDANGTQLEMRAIFDEGLGWQSESGARETIRRIREAGFNVYIPCVWHGNGTRFPSTLSQWEPNQRFYGRDPLMRLIAIAHENGIQVYPWFTVALRDKEFARLHPEFFDSESPRDAFDLHRPVFRNFMVGLIADVAQRYPIDGITLDYIRTMGICRCGLCATEYRRRFNRDLPADAAHPNVDGTLEPHLQQWQDEAVESIVRDIYSRVREFCPGCVVSVSGQPQTYPNQEGRQEYRWANAGIVDVVFDMEYADPPDVERHQFVSKQFNDPNKLVMLISDLDWKSGKPVPKDARRLKQSVEYIRGRWGTGLGLYLYSLLSDDQVKMLAGGPFSRKSRPLPADPGRGQ